MNASIAKPFADHRKRNCWLLIALLAAATWIAYLPGMNAAFLWDDAQNIVENASLRTFGEVLPYAAQTRRPVIYLTLWANYALGGLNVIGYHAFNLSVHLAAGLVLFGVVSRTLKLPGVRERIAASADRFAFCVAFIWTLHPLQTQAVTYVIQRCESMMGLLYLLCLYCLVRAAQAEHARPWYAAGLLAGWLGMGCKEVMITAPFVLLLYDRAFLSDSWQAVLRQRWGFYLGFVPAVLWLVFASLAFNAEGDQATAGFACAAVTPWEYLRSQPGVILHYLSLAALLRPLCFDYGWPVAQTSAAIWVPVAAIAGLLALSLLAFRRCPRIGFLGLSFFLILAPTSSIMPIADLAVEHRMYLPLAPLVVLTVFGFYGLVSWSLRPQANPRPLYCVAVVLIAALLSAKTFARNIVYRTPISIWSATVAAAPQNPRAHQNLGYHLHQQGAIEDAIEHYRRAIELKSDQLLTHGYLVVALAAQGRRDLAITHLREVLDEHPDFGRGHYLLGRMLAVRGESATAILHFRRSLQIQPDAAPALHGLGRELLRIGEVDEARVHLRRALQLAPEQPQYARDLARATRQSVRTPG